VLPDVQLYLSEAVAVGDARFWLIGRPDRQISPDQPYFGLVDEASKLNLNTATLEMLEWLPNMTPELAAAIIDWRDSDSDVTSGGASRPYHGSILLPLRTPPSVRRRAAPGCNVCRSIFGETPTQWHLTPTKTTATSLPSTT
jgi:hypothetical protein